MGIIWNKTGGWASEGLKDRERQGEIRMSKDLNMFMEFFNQAHLEIINGSIKKKLQK